MESPNSGQKSGKSTLFCNYFYHNLSEGRVNMSYMLSKNIDDIDEFHIMKELQDSSTPQVKVDNLS